MTDTLNAIDAMVASSMGAPSLRISSDRTTGDTTISTLPTAASQIASSSGDVVPVTSFDAAMATQQHTLIAGKIADIEAQLAEVTYDPKTGATSPKIDGRARELLQIQAVQMANELQFVARHALDQLPKVGANKGAQSEDMIAGARRQAQITELSETKGSDGKAIGRVRAAQLIDEASQRALAEKLVRGN
jgi:hypothetical protein